MLGMLAEYYLEVVLLLIYQWITKPKDQMSNTELNHKVDILYMVGYSEDWLFLEPLVTLIARASRQTPKKRRV
jgi:hypothetical protein